MARGVYSSLDSTSSSMDSSSSAYKKARRHHLKSTRNRDAGVDLDWTPFRAAEKRYKARFPPLDLSDVLDLATLDELRTDEIARSGWRGRSNSVKCRDISLAGTLGQTECGGSRKAYIVPDTPGLVLLPAFIPPAQQKRLVRWSLSDQSRHPNETNLDTHYVLPETGLWNAYLNSRSNPDEEILIQPRAMSTEDATLSDPPGPRKLVSNIPASPSNFRALTSSSKPPPTPSPTVQPTLASALLRKLRWANIGWSYHWGSKQYDFTKGKGNVNTEVTDVCKRAVECVDWGEVFETCDDDVDWGADGPDWRNWKETYEPDAGIVNFYQTKDTLMGHVDRSEVCATSPLVSISLGNAAIFLIGGLTRDVEPTPILLRSGDVIIMSGPACRRAYHGVPRILEDTLPPYLAYNAAEEDWTEYGAYLKTTRININVRQVFPRGFDPSSL